MLSVKVPETPEPELYLITLPKLRSVFRRSTSLLDSAATDVCLGIYPLQN